MPGFPLLTIGNALGGFMAGFSQSYDQGLKRQQQQQLMQMQQQELRLKQQQQQQSTQALDAAYKAALSLPGSGTATGGLNPPLPGQSSQPMAQPGPQTANLDYGIDSDSAPTKAQAMQPGGATPYSDDASQNVPRSNFRAAGPIIDHDPAEFRQTLNAAPPPQPAPPQGALDPVRQSLAMAGATPGDVPVSLPQITGNVASPNAQPSNVGPPTPADKPPQWPGINAPADANAQPQNAPPVSRETIQQIAPVVHQTAVRAAQTSPQLVYGGGNMQTMAQAIEKANPGAPPAVKFLALQQLSKLMAPDEKMQMQMMMQQNRQDIQLALKDMEINAANQRASLSRANQGWDLKEVDDPNNPGKRVTVRINKDTGDIQPLKGVTGLTNTPTAAQASKGGLPPGWNDATVTYWANVLKSGGSLPAGLARSGSAAVPAIMAKMGETGDPGDFIAKHATVAADATSLRNMTKIYDSATSYERTALRNFDLALKLAPTAVPSDLGPFFNRYVEEGETMFGDPNVPPYVTAMLTAANEYAKIMSGSTGAQGSTVDSRREAREMFSPYLSLPQISNVVGVAKQDMQNREMELSGQIDAIKGRLKTGAPTTQQMTPDQGRTQPGATYNTADDVFKAVDTGALAPDAAKQILIEKFGYQSQR